MATKRIAIIGAGASGMIAAVMAARNGAKVVLIEQNAQLGRKILSTGNGKCNFTNTHMEIGCFHGEDKAIGTVLEQFTVSDTITFFSELGILVKDRDGYLYPKSEQAKSMVDVFTMELKRLKIDILCDTRVLTTQKKGHAFILKTTKQTITCDRLIIATGGKAAPKLGSDGSGYQLAKSFGHSIVPVLPALVQLRCKGKFFRQIAGVRTEAKITILIDKKKVVEDTGEVQLTEYGISGIPVFQVSRHAAVGLYEKRTVSAMIDFLPFIESSELEQVLEKRANLAHHKTAEEFLVGMFNQKLIPVLLEAASIHINAKVSTLESKHFQQLAEVCKFFQVIVEKTNGFEAAQVCAGGVKTTEINSKTMESMLVEGLYFTGELLDVEGKCGGYNLQWAWSTGWIAGCHTAR